MVDTYLANLGVAEALGSSFGFRVLGFWQPLSMIASKRLTPEEAGIVQDVDPALTDFAHGAFTHARAAADTLPHLVSLIDLFEDVDQPLWIDWVHVNPDGNALIARTMAPAVAEAITELRTTRELVAGR